MIKHSAVQIYDVSYILLYNSFQNYSQPDYHPQRTTDTAGFKSFIITLEYIDILSENRD